MCDVTSPVWDFFKAFAGPLATVTASIVVGYFAWKQKNIAEQQKEISRNKVRLDLFDIRYDCFKTIFPYYNALLGWTGTDEEKKARTDFLMAWHQSEFLFGKPVEGIFAELVIAGNKVTGFKEHSDSYKQDPELMLKTFTEVQEILVGLFDRRLTDLKASIKPFIDFSEI